MWLCPLCQESQPDRENLSHHLTDKHSVLSACLDKLLDIVSIFTKMYCTFWKKMFVMFCNVITYILMAQTFFFSFYFNENDIGCVVSETSFCLLLK